MKQVRKISACHRRHKRQAKVKKRRVIFAGECLSQEVEAFLCKPDHVLRGLLLVGHLDPRGCRESPKVCLTLRLLPLIHL